MAFEIGEPERSHDVEPDLSGLYSALLEKLEIVDKPEWRVKDEVQRWGKDPEKVDTKQYAWTFRMTDPQWEGPDTMVNYTGRTWGQKSNAYLYGSTLLGRAVRPGESSDVLHGKHCRLSIGYREVDPETGRGGRNFVDGIKPAKASTTAVQPNLGVPPAEPTTTPVMAGGSGEPDEMPDSYWAGVIKDGSAQDDGQQ
jgi:hypothetical protein